uniref:Cytochrome P450 n=1 Tax=Oryza glumipatula TaxID=40148 RepID=A0A0E0ACC7_9ORYZ
MADDYFYLGLALASLLVVLFARHRRSAAHGDGGLRLPPGPWQLPVIGSLHHLAGKLPHRAMRDLARRHGPVMMLRLGEVPTLVVSSRDAAREVMRTHDAAFASRPLSASVRAATKGGRDIAFAPYGDYWRQLRKIAVTELLSARRVLSFRPIREEEVAATLRAVAAAAADGRTVELRAALCALVADSTVRAVVGERCAGLDVFLRQLDRAIELAAGLNVADLWPSSRLAGRLSGAVRQAERCRDTMFGVLDGIIQAHLEKTGGAGEDILDVLLRIHKEGGLEFPLDMDAVKCVVVDVISGGCETSATTLGWAFAELIRNPAAMKKATAEVRRDFEAAGAVSESALAVGELPYLRLVVRETLRLHPPLPLLLPRECREPCRVLGYDVPRGAQVLVNAWAIGRDERYWPGGSPEEFRPERFGDGEAAAAVDFKGADFELLPFGGGRRMCPGMAFGLANVELPLASLLFHFDWEASGVADPTEFDMTEAFGITARRKANLLLRPILRVPVPGDRDVFLRKLQRTIELSAGFNPADLWPSSRLAGRLGGAVREAEECHDTVYGILDGIIQEHMERTSSGSCGAGDGDGDGDGYGEDLLDVLLRIQKEGGLEFPLDMLAIKQVIFDIFGAGSETSATTLEWVMAELIRNPKAMRKATAEVRRAFAADGVVLESALGKLHYMHLVIRETFRLHTPLPLLLPRECREPCRVLGYDVPRGTQVLVNVWAIGRDERYWPGGSPEEFRPERFEDGEAAAAVDFRGADFELLPFGAGRRMCPGLAFGLANVELALASLLFHFDWEAPDVADPAEFDMTEGFGITARRKADLPLRPTLRVPVLEKKMVDASDGDGYVYVGLAVVSLFVVLLAWRSR